MKLRMALIILLTFPAWPLGFLWKVYRASFNSGQSCARQVLGRYLRGME